MKQEIWKTKCRKCNEFVYYYPAKLVMETTHDYVENMNKRVVSLTCCSCENKLSIDYEFPKDFVKI
jgi:RNase P subunit RPR2